MLLSELNWAKAKEILSKTKLALLPVGATENHGPHLALGTDWFAASMVAERASERGGWPVLPGLPVGVSEHHRQFWGTLWVPPEVLKGYVIGLARSMAYHGVRRLVFVNGHGGNTAALDMALRELRQEGIYAFIYEYWLAVSEEIIDMRKTNFVHGGEYETSVMLAKDPALVDKGLYGEAVAGMSDGWGKKAHSVSIAFDTVDFAKSGVVGDPTGASAEKGEKIIEVAGESLNRFCTWLAEQPEDALAPKPHNP